MIDLNTLKTSELVAAYNEHSGKAPISKWKRKVSDLHAILLKMKPDLFMMGFEAPQEELKAQAGRPVDHTDQTEVVTAKPVKAKKAKVAKAKKEPNGDRGAIRRHCEELLLKVKGTDPETKRPLGLPYSEILNAVTSKFPEAATSLNCLRWYATKMNKRTGKEKVVMPIRPKAKVAEAA